MQLLYILLVLLLATRVAGECAERLRQPTLVGELLAGIVLGLVAAQLGDSLPVLSGLTENEVFLAIADLGIFFLMLLAGIELQPSDLAQAPGRALAVALGGMVLPLALGLGLGWWFLPESDVRFAQALFLGTAMAVTAVPVTVKILLDLGKLRSRVGRILVSAAVYDDIISLMLLAVLTAVIRQGAPPGPAAYGVLFLKIVLFFAVTVSFGRFVFPRVGQLLKGSRADEFELSMLLVAALAYALIAEFLELHFIVGAFLAGLFFRRRTINREVWEAIRSRVSGITLGFLAPVFFASIGFHLELSAAVTIPLFLTLIVVTGFLGKLLGGGVPALFLGLPPREAAAIGVGLSARGAVELIIAGVALRAGLFERPDPAPETVAHLFSAVVIMAIVTTVVAPVAMAPLMRGVSAQEEPEGDGAEDADT